MDAKRIGIGLALAALTGVLWLASMALDHAGFIAWVALVPLWIALLRFSPAWRHAFLFALVSAEIGVGGFLGVLAFQPWMAAVAVLVPLAPSLLLSLLWALSRSNPLRLFVPLTATGLTSADMLLSLTPMAAVISPAGTQAGYPWLMAPASLLGFSCITFLLLTANGILALLLLETAGKTYRCKTVAVGGILMAAVLAASNVPRGDGPAIPVAVLQPGGNRTGPCGDAEGKARRGEEALSLQDVPIGLSREGAGKGARLIVWPESLLEVDPSSDGRRRREIEAFVARLGVPVVVTFDAGRKNLAVPVFPGRGFAEAYEKHYPAGSLGEENVAGTSEPLYRAAWGAFGLLICYDMHYEEIARRLAVRGAQLIAVPTRSQRSANARLFHVRAARLRAAENHVGFALADGDGAASLIGPRGEMLAAAGPGAQALTAPVPLGTGWTVYNRAGYLLRWLVIAAFAAGLAVAAIPLISQRHPPVSRPSDRMDPSGPKRGRRSRTAFGKESADEE